MKRLLLALAGALAVCAPAHAQVTFDMSKVSCADYSAMDVDTSRDFSAWMSGWFNQKSGSTLLNVEGYDANVASVQNWCSSNPNQMIMAALQNAVAKAAPGAGGPAEIDTSVISCGQFLSAPPDTATLVASWMGGWFMSTKNLTSIDPRYVDRNTKAVSKYCKAHRKSTLMTAIQKSWK